MNVRAKICKKALYTYLSAIIFVFCCCTAAFSQEGEPKSEGLANIPPVPAFNAGEFDLDEAAEKAFKVIGTLDFIGDDYIVVNDAPIQLAPNYRPSSSLVGQLVGIGLNSKNQANLIQRLKKRK